MIFCTVVLSFNIFLAVSACIWALIPAMTWVTEPGFAFVSRMQRELKPRPGSVAVGFKAAGNFRNASGSMVMKPLTTVLGLAVLLGSIHESTFAELSNRNQRFRHGMGMNDPFFRFPCTVLWTPSCEWPPGSFVLELRKSRIVYL